MLTTTNAIKRLHSEFRRGIKIQCLLSCDETACTLFQALHASGKVVLRKVDGWSALNEPSRTRA